MVADAQAPTAGAQQVGFEFAALDFAVDEGAADAQLGGDGGGGVEGHRSTSVTKINLEGLMALRAHNLNALASVGPVLARF